MSWVRIDDGAPDHRKQLAAGAEACWLWVCGLAYANRQKARDGFIPEAKVTVLYPLRNAVRLAAKLVEVGLWVRVADGYLIHDYREFQPSEDLRAVRAAAGRLGGKRSGEARRGAKQVPPSDEASTKQSASWTEALASTEAPLVASNDEARLKQGASFIKAFASNPDPDPDPDPDPNPPLPPAGEGSVEIRRRDPFTDDSLPASWSLGVKATTGRVCTLPVARALAQLRQALIEHGPPEPNDRVEWARTAGAEHARAHPEKAGDSFDFVRWLNAGRPVAKALAKGPAPPPPSPAHRPLVFPKPAGARS